MPTLLLAAHHLVLRPPVQQRHLPRAQPDRAPHAVHRRVPPAHHDHVRARVRHAPQRRRQLLGGQIRPHQELRRRVHPRQLLPLHAQLLPQPRPVRQEHRVPSRQILPSHVLPHPRVEAELHASGLQCRDLLVHDPLRRFEIRNPVAQHPAARRPRLEHRHPVPLQPHRLRRRQPRRPRAHHRHPLPRLLPRPRRLEAPPLLPIPIAQERLQLPDRDRLRLLPDHARPLAQRLLRAQPPAQLRHRTRRPEHGRRLRQPAHLQQCQRSRDVVVHRAGHRARRGRALDAALRLEHRRARGVPVVHLVPVVHPLVRRLLGHVMRRNPQPRLAIDRQSGPSLRLRGHRRAASRRARLWPSITAAASSG